MSAPQRSLPTPPDDDDVGYQRREPWVRRVFVVLLAAFVLAAALGVPGVGRRWSRLLGMGYELTVHYRRVTRPGLATPWSVEVRSLDGAEFDGPVVIETTADYFGLFDETGSTRSRRPTRPTVRCCRGSATGRR